MATEIAYTEEHLQKLRKSLDSGRGGSETVVKGFLFLCAATAIIFVFFIIFFLFYIGGGFFGKINLWDFLTGEMWHPGYGYYGAAPLIMGTILVSAGALIISIPISLMTAIFIAEIAPKKVKKILKGSIEILAGIPSIVFGFFGRYFISDFIVKFTPLTNGNCWLSGSIILAIMTLPTITSVCEDAIESVPKDYKEASYAMGATRWQTISKVILPAAISGIAAGIILGLGRALGETMAVTLVTGNTPQIPNPITDIFSGIRTITATLALEMGETAVGGLHREALFALAIILFIMTLIINSVANIILTRIKKKFEGKEKKNILSRLLPDNYDKKESFKRAKRIFKKLKRPIYISILLLILSLIVGTWVPWIYVLLLDIILLGIIIGYRYIPNNIKQKIWFIISYLVTSLVVFVLSFILYYIISNGLEALSNPEFLTGTPDPSGKSGGIMPAILGSLYLTLGVVLFAVPIGMFAGIYLAEYAKEGKLTKIIRAGIDNLNGTPSVVFGLFGFIFFVTFLEFGKSLLAGMLTLSLMVLPTIMRTTEEAVNSIPKSFRHASLALGSSKWQSIVKVVLPSALPGIVTGVILALGRAIGETAPLLWTCITFVSLSAPNDLFAPVMALTVHIYRLAMFIPGADVYLGGTVLVLLILVLFFYAIAFLIRSYYQKKKMW
ncbi:MAG: phosphate ABC transporter permease PstA [Promethearchaeota archaeon]|nr:MAG: phosphate ABC transporter permease PstA [Candidatus Lokiarchaeota archaeon]